MLRRIVTIAGLLGLSACSPDLDGAYVSCPYPSFTGARIDLADGRAEARLFGDRLPISINLSGSYRASAETVQVDLENPFNSSRAAEPLPKDSFIRFYLGRRSTNSGEILGPMTIVSEDGSSVEFPLTFLRVGKPGSKPVRNLECPPGS